MRTRIPLLAAVFCLLSISLYAARDFVMPELRHASTHALRDVHTNEQAAIAAEPYDAATERKVFSTKFSENDYLPVYVVVSNDGESPLELAEIRVQLVTGAKTRITPAETSDLYRRLTRRRKKPTIKLAPLPVPGTRPEVGPGGDAEEEIEQAMFRARAVEPRASRAGFFFFDVRDLDDPLNGAKLFVTGVARDGQQLMYFEVPLSGR